MSCLYINLFTPLLVSLILPAACPVDMEKLIFIQLNSYPSKQDRGYVHCF